MFPRGATRSCAASSRARTRKRPTRATSRRCRLSPRRGLLHRVPHELVALVEEDLSVRGDVLLLAGDDALDPGVVPIGPGIHARHGGVALLPARDALDAKPAHLACGSRDL